MKTFILLLILAYLARKAVRWANEHPEQVAAIGGKLGRALRR